MRATLMATVLLVLGCFLWGDEQKQLAHFLFFLQRQVNVFRLFLYFVAARQWE